MCENSPRALTVINRLERARHEARDRTGYKNATGTPGAHIATDFLNEIERTDDIRVDDMRDVFERLVEKPFPQTKAGVR